MLRLGLARLAGAIASILGASFISFCLLRILPGDPARLIVGHFGTERAVQDERHVLGLDQPLYIQYLHYIRDFVTGNWGYSYSAGEPVSTQIASRFPATLELAVAAFVLAFVSAVLLALVATYRRSPWLDRAVRAVASIGLGTPPFWLGLIMLVVFSQAVHILPGPEGRLMQGASPPPHLTGFYTIDALAAGRWGTLGDALRHLVLPALTLGFAPFAFLVRLLRSNLLEVAREPFLTVARSKGLGRWTTFRRHALPNAFLATLTAGGLVVAQLVTGSVLVEKVFNWPGVGALVVDGLLQKDFAVVQAFILIGAITYVTINLCVDVLYGMIDPRTRTPVAEA